MADKWRRLSEAMPPEGTEVLLKFDGWVDPVFNLEGVRVGIRICDDLVYAKFDPGLGSYFGQATPLRYTDLERVKWKVL